jgi:hypothetical protein
VETKERDSSDEDDLFEELDVSDRDEVISRTCYFKTYTVRNKACAGASLPCCVFFFGFSF